MKGSRCLTSTWVGLTIGATCLSLAGCAPWGPEGTLGYIGNNRVSVASANQLLGPSDTDKIESFSDQRLIALIDPRTLPKPASHEEYGETLDDAIKNFDNPALWGGASNAPLRNLMRQRRNEIQATVILASNNRCNLFKSYLKHLDSSVNFGFGAITTLFGGLGSIVNGEQAARIFSGLAGMSSGVRSEFDQDFLARIATSVIIPGIERARADTMKQIVERRCLSADDYPVTLAIADAIRYHGACSLDVGIAASGQAIAREDDPGLARVNEVLTQIKKNRQLTADLALLETKRPTKSVTALQKDAADAKGKATQLQAAATNDQKAAKGAAAEAKSDPAKQDAADAAQKKADASSAKAAAAKTKADDAQKVADAAADDASDNKSKPLLGDDVPLKACDPLP